jgi:choline dehydrogenase-like flavoprotein
MMTFGASLCAASVKVLPESATPDVQCVFAPRAIKRASFASSTIGRALSAVLGKAAAVAGNHGMSVIDEQLRVHGLERLRIIDASVMPAVSSTNINAPTIMVAEKGAALIKDSAREKLAA